MSKPENNLDQTSTLEEKALASTSKDAPECPGTAAVEAIINSMRILATDEKRRKEIGMMLV